MVICLGQGAGSHMAQQMPVPLPLTVGFVRVYIHRMGQLCFWKYLKILSSEFYQIFRVLGVSYDLESIKISVNNSVSFNSMYVI